MVAPDEPTQPTWKFTQYVFQRLVFGVEMNHCPRVSPLEALCDPFQLHVHAAYTR